MADDPNKKKAFPSCPFPQSDDGHSVRVTRSTTRLAESAQKSSFPGELRNIVTPPSQHRKHGRGGRRGGGRSGRGWASQPVYLHSMNHAGPAKMEHDEACSVVGTANTADSAPPEVIPLMITANSPIKVRSATKAVLTKITLVEEGIREVDVPKTKKRPAALGNSPPSKRRYTEETADGSITEVISRTTEIERDMKPKKSDVEQIVPGGNSISNLGDSRASQPVPARTLSLKNVPTANIAKLDLVDRPKWPTSRTTTKHQIKIVDLDKLMTKIDTPFIDSHCHLDFIYGRVKQETGEGGYLDEWKKKFHNAFPKNFKGCIPNFIEPDLWFDRGIKRTDIDWIRRQVQSPLVLGATYGVHPHEAHLYSAYLEKHLREVLTRSEFKPIAVGECGLDAQKGLANIKTEQFAAFESQVMLAKEFDLPIVIHCRGPNRDDEYLVEKKCLEIMKKVKLSRWHSIHRHCFKVDYAAYELWTRNFPNTYFGFTPLTGPIDDGLKTAIEKIPLDRMLLETDSPYFRPRQFDVSNDAGPSKCSLPGMAICAAAIIAQLKKIDVEKVLEATEQNTRRCYGLYDDIVE